MHKCEHCHRTFEPSRDGQRFCVGRGCRQAWHRENMNVTQSPTRDHPVAFDQSVPYPKGRGSRYEFIHNMQAKTDSVYIECNGDKKKLKNERSRARDYAASYGIAITTRTEKTGFRLWRRFDDLE